MTRQRPAGGPGAPLDRGVELLGRDPARARRLDERAARLDERHGERRSAGRRRAARPAPARLARGERRRVDDDEVEATAAAGQVGHHGERVADDDVVAARPHERRAGLWAMLRRAVSSAGALWSTLERPRSPRRRRRGPRSRRCRRTRRAPADRGRGARRGPGCRAGRGSGRSSGPARRRPRTSGPSSRNSTGSSRQLAGERHAVERRRRRRAPPAQPQHDRARGPASAPRASTTAPRCGQPRRGVGLDDERRRRSGRRPARGSPSFSPCTTR